MKFHNCHHTIVGIVVNLGMYKAPNTLEGSREHASICNFPYHGSAKDKLHFYDLLSEGIILVPKFLIINNLSSAEVMFVFSFCLLQWMPFYLKTRFAKKDTGP